MKTCGKPIEQKPCDPPSVAKARSAESGKEREVEMADARKPTREKGQEIPPVAPQTQRQVILDRDAIYAGLQELVEEDQALRGRLAR